MVDKEATRATWRRWYDDNREEFNARRRERYKKDKEYADRLRDYARERKRSMARTDEGLVLREYARRKYWAWKIAEVARVLGMSVRQIREMEKLKLIPPSIFQESTRAYTTKQVDLIEMMASLWWQETPKSEMAAAKKAVRSMWRDDLGADEAQ